MPIVDEYVYCEECKDFTDHVAKYHGMNDYRGYQSICQVCWNVKSETSRLNGKEIFGPAYYAELELRKDKGYWLQRRKRYEEELRKKALGQDGDNIFISEIESEDSDDRSREED